MDLYDTSSRASQRDLTDELSRYLSRYGVVAKYFVALVCTVAVGFGLRFVFENQLGQVFGAMLVWFSILFGIAGTVFVGLFVVRGAVADWRHDR